MYHFAGCIAKRTNGQEKKRMEKNTKRMAKNIRQNLTQEMRDYPLDATPQFAEDRRQEDEHQQH